MPDDPRAPTRASRSTRRPSSAASWSTSSSPSRAATRPPAASSPPAPRRCSPRTTGAEEVLLTTSCTSALELSAMMLDLGPEDTVVVPSFTFTSTALAFARQGARLVFCDIEPRTLGLDPAHLATLLDDSRPRGRAGALRRRRVRHGGRAARCCADRPDVALVEDNAHGLFGAWQGRAARQPRTVRGAELPRDQELRLRRGRRAAAQRRRRRRPGPGALRQGHQPAGVPARARSTSTPGRTPARRSGWPTCSRRTCWRSSSSGRPCRPSAARSTSATPRCSRRTPRTTRSRCPDPPADRESAYHMFYLLLPDKERRNAVLGSMRDAGVTPTFHYVPLHSSDAGKMFAARTTECPVTEDISGRLLRLPFYNDLSAGRGRAGRHRRSCRRSRCQPPWSDGSPASRSTGSSSLRQPTTGGTAPARTCSRPSSAATSAQPSRMLDVGSADGPSVEWMRGAHRRVTLDLFPEGLEPGAGVQGSAMALPFARRGLRRGRRLRRRRALRGRRARGLGAQPGAAARRPDAAVGAGVRLGVVGPRRPGRPPPPLHPPAAGAAGRAGRADRRAVDVRVRRRCSRSSSPSG